MRTELITFQEEIEKWVKEIERLKERLSRDKIEKLNHEISKRSIGSTPQGTLRGENKNKSASGPSNSHNK
jgi:hypothetical protein